MENFNTTTEVAIDNPRYHEGDSFRFDGKDFLDHWYCATDHSSHRLVWLETKRNFPPGRGKTIEASPKRQTLKIKTSDPYASDPTGLTPQMAASHSGKVEILEILLNVGVPLESKDSSGYTALMFSCNAVQLSCARFLIEKGANINEVDNKGSTPIMFCAQHGFNDIVRMSTQSNPRRTGIQTKEEDE